MTPNESKINIREIQIVHFDDHSLFRTGVKNAIEKTRNDFKIYGIDEYYSALKYISDCFDNNIQIDLVITDFNHPGPNGYVFANEVKRIAKMHDKDLPVILLTMSTIENPKIVQGLEENIFDKHLTKASDSPEIIEAINSALRLPIEEIEDTVEYASQTQTIEEPVQWLTPKGALLSVLYIVLLIPFAWLLNLGVDWFLNQVVFKLFEWFNHLSIFWKVILLFFQGFFILLILLALFRGIGNLLSYFVFQKLPDNTLTISISTLIFLGNSILGVIAVWNAIPRFTFWIFIEFILLVTFIFSVNTVLLPWYVKSKARKNYNYGT